MPKDKDEEECVVFKVPFVGDHSYSFGKKMKKLLESVTKKTVRIVYTSFKIKNYFSLKCRTPKQLLSNVVYQFKCQHDAEVSYIGETKRHLITRVKEHLAVNNSSMKSEVKSHVLNCDSCMSGASIKSFKVLKKSRSNFENVIYEALNIRRLSPTLNKKLFNRGSLFTLKVF